MNSECIASLLISLIKKNLFMINQILKICSERFKHYYFIQLYMISNTRIKNIYNRFNFKYSKLYVHPFINLLFQYFTHHNMYKFIYTKNFTLLSSKENNINHYFFCPSTSTNLIQQK